ASLLRMVEAVNDVEHRRLAGAVRADDRADFSLADVEGDAAHRLHAAERERHVLHRQEHIADSDIGSADGSHGGAPRRALTLPWRGRVAEQGEAGWGDSA